MRLKDDGGLKSISGDEVKSLETLDGYKHKMENGWLLIRPSGTEPVLRIYSEAGSRAQAEAYVNDAIEQLGL